MPIRSEIQMIFQDPYSSLNPRHTVGTIVGTPLRVHNMVPEKKVLARVQELLEVVGLNPEHYNRYPQRVLRRPAPAHRHRPRARPAAQAPGRRRAGLRARRVDPGAGDEPAGKLQKEFGIAFLFIAHDLGVVRHFCPQVAVMYLGKIVEIGDRETIYEAPTTRTPRPCCRRRPTSTSRRGIAAKERIRLVGDVPSPIDPPSGCRFRTRCWKAQDICAKQEPPLVSATAEDVDPDLPRGRRAPAGVPLPGGQDRPRRRGPGLTA